MATGQLDSGTPVVSVSGEVLITAKVIVDLTACRFLDSKALTALLATRARLARANRALALILSGPKVLKIFEITGFDQLFDIYPSLKLAIQGEPAGYG